MTGPTDNPGAFAYHAKYRRRRKWQGADWTPGTVSANPEDGIWCPEHRMRHGYKSKGLGVYYEKGTNHKWKALWFCRSSGAVIMEMELGGSDAD